MPMMIIRRIVSEDGGLTLIYGGEVIVLMEIEKEFKVYLNEECQEFAGENSRNVKS